MSLQDSISQEKPENPTAGRVGLEEENLQYNKQDMDQEQRVDLNPVQLNSQNINIHLDFNKYCGRITGTISHETNNKMISNIPVLLFFGSENQLPVYQTNSDINGNFIIDDIPPGYYTLVFKYDVNSSCRSHYVKVLPGQTAHQSIVIKDSNPHIIKDSNPHPPTRCYYCQP